MRFVLAVLPASLALLSASPVVAAGFDAHRLWTVPGDPGSRFGSAVAAGDVNGDGFRDVIVGASNAITSAGEPDGKAFAYYGGPGGLPDTPSWSAEGERGINPSSLFGATLVTADVNRDGFDDLIVGSWRFQVFADHDNGAGRLYAYYGSAQGLPAAPSFVADGIDYDLGHTTGIGYTLDTGDFNGDGFPDIAASNYSRYTGGVFVYFGSLSGLSLQNSWIVVGAGFPLIDLGATASAGDFDGDGFDDLLVTTQSQSFPIEPDMVAFIFRGSPVGFPPVSPGEPPPAAFTFTNWTTARSVGDVDGDGFDDILALELDDGGCLCNPPNYVLFRGSPSGPVRAQELPPSLDDLYPVLNGIGDLNGDGFADLIAVEQQLYLVHFGSASGLDPMSNGMGRVPAGPFVAAGDFNGDGTSDLLVGDGSNDRADLYRGGTDWSFTSTADLAVEQIAFEGGNPEAIFDMTVTNRGPDAVRLRLFDPIPATMAGSSWYCRHEPYGPPSGATARCFYPPQRTGDVDSIITIAPGGTILHELGGGITSPPVVNTAYLILGPGVEDSDLSNNQATAVLGPPLQIVFRDDFESGDLSAWSFQTGRGLEVAPEASLQGRYGLAVSPRVAGSAVVRDDSPTGESDYHAHFLFQPERTGSPAVGGLRGAHAATLFSGRAGSSPVSLFQVLLERKEHSLALRARARLDDGTLRESVSVPITAARHLIEVAWRRSGGPAVNDGQLLLRLDGKDAALLASLDNDAGGGVDSVELGLADAGRPFFAGRRGGVRLDAFLSWRPN